VDEAIELIRKIVGIVGDMSKNGQQIPPQIQERLTQILNSYSDRIESQQRPIEEPTSVPIPKSADLAWILAGGDPNVFKSYLQTIPDPELNALARNPIQVQQAINRLEHQITVPHGESSPEGIPRADLTSSNVYGFKYDPRNKRLIVKFQGNEGLAQGPVYEYEGVPPSIFKLFSQGAAQAKTSGQNKWGKWWIHKSPSLGASMNEFIKKAGFPYQKVA